MHSRDNCDIRRTLYSTPRPSRPHTMRVSRYNRSIARRWTVLGKLRHTAFRVPLTKKCLRAPFVARNKITTTNSIYLLLLILMMKMIINSLHFSRNTETTGGALKFISRRYTVRILLCDVFLQFLFKI